uniref:Uncharacterized protein n=1 Tax=Nyssomyia neivai TaxID=330878 RepID=A0A1L8DBN5_9DIPT
MSFRNFWKKYTVTIVMIPSIIGIHYAWTKIQNVDSLVSEYEREDLPIIIGAKRIYKEYFNKSGDAKKEEDR